MLRLHGAHPWGTVEVLQLMWRHLDLAKPSLPSHPQEPGAPALSRIPQLQPSCPGARPVCMLLLATSARK